MSYFVTSFEPIIAMLWIDPNATPSRMCEGRATESFFICFMNLLKSWFLFSSLKILQNHVKLSPSLPSFIPSRNIKQTYFSSLKNCEICDYNRKIMGCDRTAEGMVRDAFTMMSCKSHHHKNYDFFLSCFAFCLPTFNCSFRDIFPNYYASWWQKMETCKYFQFSSLNNERRQKKRNENRFI